MIDIVVRRMTKLPPGFTLEVKLHLTEHNPPIDDVTGAPFLDLENYCCGVCTSRVTKYQPVLTPFIPLQAHMDSPLSSFVASHSSVAQH